MNARGTGETRGRFAGSSRVFLLALLGMGCRPGVEADLADLRAEIARLERDVPPEAPLWVDEGPNAFPPHLEDYSARIPDFVYNHIVRKLAKAPPADLAAQARGTLSPAACLRDPGAHRGRFWKVAGTIAALEPIAIADRDAGVDRVYSGVVFVDGQPVLLHVVDKPDVVYVGRDGVESHAIFVKIITYTARNGRRIDAPFLIGRRMGKYY